MWIQAGILAREGNAEGSRFFGLDGSILFGAFVIGAMLDKEE
jgi:hypothetical protein